MSGMGETACAQDTIGNAEVSLFGDDEDEMQLSVPQMKPHPLVMGHFAKDWMSSRHSFILQSSHRPPKLFQCFLWRGGLPNRNRPQGSWDV